MAWQGGYTERYQEEIEAEMQVREIGSEILHYCGGLVKDFGYFDKGSLGEPLSLPYVIWDVDGYDGLHLVLSDETGESPPRASFNGGSVPEYLPRNVREIGIFAHLSSGNSIEVVNMLREGGSEQSDLITDCMGQRLDQTALELVMNDLAHYREQIERDDVIDG